MNFNGYIQRLSFYYAIAPTYLLLFWFPEWLVNIAVFQLSALIIFLYQTWMLAQYMKELHKRLVDALQELDIAIKKAKAEARDD